MAITVRKVAAKGQERAVIRRAAQIESPDTLSLMFGKLHPVQPGAPATTKGRWRHMAQRKTYQKSEPTEENGQWKIRYRVPIEQSDGSIRRVQKTKCLGSVSGMTLSQARKERDR